MTDRDVTLIDLTYLLIAVESTMIWRTSNANLVGRSSSQTSMDVDNGNIGSLEKLSLSNGNGSAMVKSFDQMVKRNAKSEIVSCTIPKESVRFYYQEKGYWLRSCHIYLRDLKDGKVKMFDSTQNRRNERKLKGRVSLF
ncbi:hypothetical protein Lser_V15G26230 [Lactuca serriola]